MRQPYPSDVSREQFAKIYETLSAARKQTKPRRLDLYEVFCGVLYVLKGGIQWRMLPQEYPKWRSVYAYWQIWSEAPDGSPSTLEMVLKKIGWRGPTKPWSKTHYHASYY
jgi:hypothetical protein